MQRRQFVSLAAAGVILPHLRGIPFRAPGGPGVIDAAAFHAMRRFQSTTFGRIACIERGEGPVALFIHGLPLNSFQWRGALERLSSVRRCLAPDLMGLGYSETPETQDLSPIAQADMLAALLDQLEIRDVDLVGNDSGGGVAQLFLARHPQRVRTLLLTNCDTAANSLPPALLPIIDTARKGTLVDDVMIPWLADKAKCRAQLGTAFTRATSLTDECIEVYIRPVTTSAVRRSQFQRYHVALEQNALRPILPTLQHSTVPVRVVWGTADDLFPLPDGEALAQTFPASRGIRRVEGGKLFWPEEFPDVIAEEARRLWGHS